MALSIITCSPEIGSVGTEATFSGGGEIAGELRWYLKSAPVASSLVTLATYEKSMEEARLKVTTAGRALFTPDVPGQYEVEGRDVTVSVFVPHYQGHSFETDPSSPWYQTDGTLEALQATQTKTYWVAQTISRKVGFGTDQSTITVRTYGTVLDRLATDYLVLMAGTTPRAKLAATDPNVLRLLDWIRANTQSVESLGLAPMSQVNALIQAWNEHVSHSEWQVHGAPDATNALASTADPLPSLAAIGARLDEIRTKYESHRVLTTGSVHHAADNAHVAAIGSYGTFAAALAYYEALYPVVRGHAESPSYHDPLASWPSPVDGNWGEITQQPETLAELAVAAGKLSVLYQDHLGKEIQEYHAAGDGLGPDAANLVPEIDATDATLPDLIRAANDLAAAMGRHVQNLDGASAPASTPYHPPTAPRSRIVQSRAIDARTLAYTLEECVLAFYDHVFVQAGSLTKQHKAVGWGNHAVFNILRSPYGGNEMFRLQHYYARALDGAGAPTTPAQANSGATYLQKVWGWT